MKTQSNLLRTFRVTDTNFILLLFYTYFTFVWLLPAAQMTDIDTYDEIHMYINGGITFFNNIQKGHNPDFGPFYALWYGLLNIFQRDLFSLFYLNRSLILALTGLFFFVYLRSSGVPWHLSILSFILLMFNPFFLTINRSVNHFAQLLLLIIFSIANRIKDFTYYWCTICLAFLVASYVRPEYFLSFTLVYFSLTMTFIIRMHNISLKKWVIIVFSFGVYTTIVIGIGGPPIGNLSESKSKGFDTFIIKNLERISTQGNSTMKGVATRETIMDLYRNPNSLLSALLSNHHEFKRHVVYNFRKYFKDLWMITQSIDYLLLTPFFVLFILSRLVFHQNDNMENRSSELSLPEHRFYIVTSLAILPILASSFIYGPLIQYTMGQLPFIISLLIMGMSVIQRKIWEKSNF